MTPGGQSEEKPADAVIENLLVELKSSVEEKLGRPVEHLTPLSYKTQVVAGTNYFVKAKISDAEVIHIRIYKHFSGTTMVHSLLEGKAETDTISYF